VLRNLTKLEAESFERACPFILFDKVLLDVGDRSRPISSEDMARLRDSGIIVSFAPGICRLSKWSSSKINYADVVMDIFYVNQGNNFVFINTCDVQGVDLGFRYWELTSAGQELYRVIRKQIPDQLEALAEALCADHPELAAKLN